MDLPVPTVAIGRLRPRRVHPWRVPRKPCAGLHSRCVVAKPTTLGDASPLPTRHLACGFRSAHPPQTTASPPHADGPKSPPIWNRTWTLGRRPRPQEATWPRPTPTSTTSQRKQIIRKAAESDRVDKRSTWLDLREKRPTFAALERRGCGEIGRHARLRIWCFGVGVRVPPPAHFQETIRQPESPP